jgi:hypothetical protein
MTPTGRDCRRDAAVDDSRIEDAAAPEVAAQ